MRNLPEPEEVMGVPDELLVMLFRALRDSLMRAGRPDAKALNVAAQQLLGAVDAEGEPEPMGRRFLTRQALTVLAEIGTSFDEGDLVGIGPSESDRGLEDLLGGHFNGEIADMFGRFRSNLYWLSENSVWRLPRVLGLHERVIG